MTTVTSTPANMPTATTTKAANVARPSSLRSTRASARNAPGSRSPYATTRMTAARADFGNGAKSGVRISSVTTTRPRTTRLSSWERPPTSAAVKLRDWLPLTGNPPVRAAPTLAAPRPASSWSPSTRSPLRRASTWPVTPLSANTSRAMPSAGPASATTSPRLKLGSPSEGSPGCDLADHGHALIGKVEERADRDGHEHRDEVGRQAPVDAPQRHCRHHDDDADQQRERVGLAESLECLAELGEGVVGGLQRDAQQAVELADDHHDGRAGHVPGEERARQEARHEAESQDPCQDQPAAGRAATASP